MLLRFYGPVDKTAEVPTEECFYVETSAPLDAEEEKRLRWFLSDPADKSSLESVPMVLEIGPRLHVETPYSTTAKTILSMAGLIKVTRIEKSRRLGLSATLNEQQADEFLRSRHDLMTEVHYLQPLTSFGTPPPAKSMRVVETLGPSGRDNLLAEAEVLRNEVADVYRLAGNAQPLDDLFHLRRVAGLRVGKRCGQDEKAGQRNSAQYGFPTCHGFLPLA